MTRVLVTGSEGFIGKKSVLRFRHQGYDVYTLDRVGSGEKHYVGDIATLELNGIISAVLPEIIVHTAAQTDVMSSFADPEQDFLTNAYGTLRLLMASQEFNVKTFVYIHSGGAVYDSNQPMPLSEISLEKPISPYGVSKSTGENFVRIMCSYHGINWASLALSNVYGDFKENPKGVIFEFWKGLTTQQECQINGTQVTRDFIHVDDVVEAILLSTIRPPNRRVNISSGIEISLLETYELLSDLLGVSQNVRMEPPRSGEVLRSCLNNALASELLKWKPKISMKEGLSRALSAEVN
jgi:UDP-glucose 4-epimerase